MIAPPILLPEAFDDVAEAYVWYENRSVGLGDRFLDRVDECIDRIRRNPELCERIYKDYRRSIVHRFPYVIFYEHRADTITIYSVFHSAQDPQKWRERLP